MPNASKALIFSTGVLALAGCHKHTQDNAAANQDITIEGNLPTSETSGNTEIETLPADESSTTSSRELQNGRDNPDVNGVGNND